MDAYVNFNVEGILDKLGFGADRALQKQVDEQVLTECELYVPYDTGTLKDSGTLYTDTGSGYVKYHGPQARYLYYHPEFDYQGAPMRGAYWADRAMQNGGKERIVKSIKEEIAKRCRKK